MVTHSQWYVVLLASLALDASLDASQSHHDSRVRLPWRPLSPLNARAPLAWRRRDPPGLASHLPLPIRQHRARPSGGCSASMSGRSSPRSPSSPQAAAVRGPWSSSSLTSKADKADVYDANIRNFAPVARIMKTALPENAKIAKEAKECMQECVSEFISFITSEGKPVSEPPARWTTTSRFRPLSLSRWSRRSDLSQRPRNAIRRRGKRSTEKTSSSP